MADGPDHSLCCPKNENHLGFKVADGQTIVCIALIMKIIDTFSFKKPAYKKLNAANLEAFETDKLRRTTSKKPDNL